MWFPYGQTCLNTSGACYSRVGSRERDIRPPDGLTFSAGESANLLIEKLHGGQETVKVQLPIPKSKTHPVNAPEAVYAEKLSDEIGLLKSRHVPWSDRD